MQMLTCVRRGRPRHRMTHNSETQTDNSESYKKTVFETLTILYLCALETQHMNITVPVSSRWGRDPVLDSSRRGL